MSSLCLGAYLVPAAALLPVSLWLLCLLQAPQRLTCQHLLPSLKPWLCHVFVLRLVFISSLLRQPGALPCRGVLIQLTSSSTTGMP